MFTMHCFCSVKTNKRIDFGENKCVLDRLLPGEAMSIRVKRDEHAVIEGRHPWERHLSPPGH